MSGRDGYLAALSIEPSPAHRRADLFDLSIWDVSGWIRAVHAQVLAGFNLTIVLPVDGMTSAPPNLCICFLELSLLSLTLG